MSQIYIKNPISKPSCIKIFELHGYFLFFDSFKLPFGVSFGVRFREASQVMKIFQAVRLNQLFLSRIRELEKQRSAKLIFFTHSFEFMRIQRLGAAEASRTSDNCFVRLRT